MEAAEYDRLRALEDRYWWHVARRRLALALLRRYAPSAARVLDLGCGTGRTLVDVGAMAAYSAGADPSPVALQACRRRGLERLVRATGEALPFRDGSFDAVLSLDSLEHIADDAAAARELTRVLRVGGTAVVTVPALRLLWSVHDEALMHHRRYTRGGLARRLREGGLELRKVSFATFFLFPVVLALRLLQRLLPRSHPEATLPQIPRWVNGLLVALHAFENRLVLATGLPLGVSLAAVATRTR